MEKVLVTGASGFIALHAIEQLLQKDYAVKGTVRDLDRVEEIKTALTVRDNDISHLEFIECDLENENNWDEATADVQYVLHIASPFIVGLPKDENELISPAVKGTEIVFKYAAKNKIKKIILTSSCAAITDKHTGQKHFTEEDWTDVEHPNTSAYFKSKTLAEKRAWDLYNHQPEGEHKVELAVINPSVVIGPSLTRDIGTSNEFIKKIVMGKMPGCPRLHYGFVDVRDVARAHILALENDAANGQRFIISNTELWFKELCDILRTKDYKAPHKKMSDFMVKIAGIWDKEVKQISTMLGVERFTPAEKAAATLGWKPRPIEGTILHTAFQVRRFEMLKKNK